MRNLKGNLENFNLYNVQVLCVVADDDQTVAAMSKKPVGHPYTFSKASSNACSILPHSVVICKLCNGLAVKPTYLQCKHSFCDLCLVNYVKIKKYQESLDFPCPYCGNLSAPPWGIWHLSDKVIFPYVFIFVPEIQTDIFKACVFTF